MTYFWRCFEKELRSSMNEDEDDDDDDDDNDDDDDVLELQRNVS